MDIIGLPIAAPSVFNFVCEEYLWLISTGRQRIGNEAIHSHQSTNAMYSGNKGDSNMYGLQEKNAITLSRYQTLPKNISRKNSTLNKSAELTRCEIISLAKYDAS